jgi:Putative peptidoglycan binding domain
MSIWIGHDGTLNDDEGDGPAVAGDPVDILVGADPMFSQEVFAGQDYFVGQDDFGSALGDIGSSLGSALGDSGGGSGGSGGGGLGSLFGDSGGGAGGASSLASLFGGGDSGGSGDTGSAIADIFGKVAKVAVPAVTKAISQANAPKGSAPAATSSAPMTAPLAPAAPSATAPHAPSASPAHVSQHRKALDPKARLNLVLTHLAKKYGLPAPQGAPGSTFVSKMMAPKPAASSAATTGMYVGDLSDLLEDLSGAVHHGFHSHREFHPHFSSPVFQAQTYTVPTPRFGQSQYGQTSYAQPYPSGYHDARQYTQPQYAPQYAQPQYTQAQHAAPVTYSHDAAYDLASPLAHQGGMTQVTATATRKVKPVLGDDGTGAKVKKFVSKMMGGSAYGSGKSAGSGGSVARAYGGSGGNEGVRNTQRLLNAYWHSKVLAEDGIMGPETIKFIKEFQRQQHLPITGQDDAATHALLATTPLPWGTPFGDDSSSVPPQKSLSDDVSDWAEAFKKTGQFWTQPPPLTIAQQIAAEGKKKP